MADLAKKTLDELKEALCDDKSRPSHYLDVGFEAIRRCLAAESELAQHQEDARLAAGELLVPLPTPGTDAARMMRANVLMRRQRDAAREELAATRSLVESAQADRQRAVDDLFAEAKRSQELQAELTATRAKLAEVERELKQARHVAAGSADNTKRLFRELASARRVVEAVTDAWARYQRNDLSREEFEGFIAERFETSSPGYALASAGTDAGRTEARRPEAGESRPVCDHCGHSAEAHGYISDNIGSECDECSCARFLPPEFPCCGGSDESPPEHTQDCHTRAKPPEEPKPEPRCTYWRPGWERQCGLVTDGADLCPAHLMLSTRKFGLNVRPEETNVDIPRRDRIDQMTPAELAIRAAVEAVERVGAHPLLTDAVNLLHEAQGRVADYVDTTAEPKPEAPRSEAGEHDWYRGFDGAYHSHDWHCAHCGEGRNGSEPDARGCKGRPKPTEEPKPEPQPSGELRRGPASGKVGE